MLVIYPRRMEKQTGLSIIARCLLLIPIMLVQLLEYHDLCKFCSRCIIPFPTKTDPMRKTKCLTSPFGGPTLPLYNQKEFCRRSSLDGWIQILILIFCRRSSLYACSSLITYEPNILVYPHKLNFPSQVSLKCNEVLKENMVF